MAIGVRVAVFVIEDVHRSYTHIERLVEREPFKVTREHELIHVRSLGSTHHRVTRQDVTFGTREVENHIAVQASKHRFGTELTNRFAHIGTELEVCTLKVALVTFDELFMFSHVTLAGKDLRFVHDVDTGEEKSQRRVLLPKVTHDPVEGIANIAFDIEPRHRDRLRSRGEVFLHTGGKTDHCICADVFPRTEAEVNVGRNEFVLFDTRHLVDTGRIVVGIEPGCLGDSTNGTRDFNTALCVDGINLAFKQFLVFYNRCCRSSHRGGKDCGKSLFHIHNLFHVQHPLLEPSLGFG